ncbi:MAG: hypothetical protein QOF04_2804, partial [Solirubrobacteraceae bacterium]|nr:hypothetical protein [Solirubrobacteraceae bacterium]
MITALGAGPAAAQAPTPAAPVAAAALTPVAGALPTDLPVAWAIPSVAGLPVAPVIPALPASPGKPKYGLPGPDRLRVTAALGGTLYGVEGADHLSGGPGPDRLYGQTGPDTALGNGG